MYLKRQFDRSEPGAPQALPKVKVLRLSDRQRFSPSAVLEGVMAGFMTLSRGRLVIHGTAPGAERTAADVVFKIKRVPGLWCCHCRARMSDSVQAQQHVIANHAGQASPDRNNPAGYEQLNALDCERE